MSDFKSDKKDDSLMWVEMLCPLCGDMAIPTPKLKPVKFPTMLRQMWSGGEVQAWLDENVNKEKNT